MIDSLTYFDLSCFFLIIVAICCAYQRLLDQKSIKKLLTSFFQILNLRHIQLFYLLTPAHSSQHTPSITRFLSQFTIFCFSKFSSISLYYRNLMNGCKYNRARLKGTLFLSIIQGNLRNGY